MDIQEAEKNTRLLSFEEWEELNYLKQEDDFLEQMMHILSLDQFNKDWCNIVIARGKLKRWKENNK